MFTGIEPFTYPSVDLLDPSGPLETFLGVLPLPEFLDPPAPRGCRPALGVTSSRPACTSSATNCSDACGSSQPAGITNSWLVLVP